MRFAIATDNESEIAAYTGKCRGFVIYDANDGTASRVGFRQNDYTRHVLGESSDASGHDEHEGDDSHGALLDALSDCQAIVTRGMGFRFVADLRNRGITPFVCSAQTVDEAAGLLARGRLTLSDRW
jgi:predicted Fe-Mo cluster-binding NifX family protein